MYLILISYCHECGPLVVRTCAVLDRISPHCMYALPPITGVPASCKDSTLPSHGDWTRSAAGSHRPPWSFKGLAVSVDVGVDEADREPVVSFEVSAGQATRAGPQGGVLITMLYVTLARSLAFLSRDTVADQAVCFHRPGRVHTSAAVVRSIVHYRPGTRTRPLEADSYLYPSRQRTSSPGLAKLLMPFPLGGHHGGGGGLGLRDELDCLVEGGYGAQGGLIVGGGGGLQQDEGVGGVLLAEGPGLVVGGPEQACGGRGLEAQGGRAVGLEEGEQLRGQLEQLVGGAGGGVVEGDAGDGLAGEHDGLWWRVVVLKRGGQAGRACGIEDGRPTGWRCRDAGTQAPGYLGATVCQSANPCKRGFDPLQMDFQGRSASARLLGRAREAWRAGGGVNPGGWRMARAERGDGLFTWTTSPLSLPARPLGAGGGGGLEGCSLQERGHMSCRVSPAQIRNLTGQA